MAIQLQSTSQIELILKDALLNEGITFKEQYPIYDGGKFSTPKYFVDFYLIHNSKKLIVECDGYEFHTSDYDVEKNIKRDNWIKSKTGIKIVHFTAYQIKKEIKTVLKVIKSELGIEKFSKKELLFKGKKRRKSYINNIDDKHLHEVTLFFDFIQSEDLVWITYRFHDVTVNKFSDIRYKAFYNVPQRKGRDLALLSALLDLKRSTKILCYCQSEWLVSYLNKTVLYKNKDGILKKIDEILSNHNYLAKCITIKRGPSFFYNPSSELMILSEVHSKCKQIRYGRIKNFTREKYEDFNLFIENNQILI